MAARTRSLFVRLLVAQVLVALLLTFTLAAIFYTERNRAVAELLSLRWAPTLVALAEGRPVESLAAPGRIRVADRRPTPVFEIASFTPRLAMVRDALLADGVPIVGLLFGRDEPGAEMLLWLALRSSDGGTRWVGFESGIVETRLRERAVLAVVLIAALAVAASAFIARRLARPLEALRARIAADDASGAPLPQASAEVLAIDEAWRTLRGSLDRQERERALLLAGVSHDLRSPLARIRMAAELLPEQEGVAARREAIVRNAALADRLVGSFVDHVRSGELPLDEAVDLSAVLRAAATRLAPMPGEIEVDAPPRLVAARANAVLIERMVANLVDNAFTHGQPPVRLHAAAPRQGWLRVEVEDGGPGIAPDRQEAMQQAFARGDAARTRPGLGLGLAIVQRVAQRLGGEVSFQRSADGSRHAVRVDWPGG